MGTNAKITPDQTLSHLVSVEPQAAQMLKSIGLDPSQHKDETLRAACKQRQWNEVEVLQWIKKHRSLDDKPASKDDSSRESDFGKDVVKWCEFIEENIHVSTLRLLNEISQDFPRVLQVHGNQYPWLKNMKWHFEHFQEVLRLYLEFEKKKFFPLIRRWYKSKSDVLDGTLREIQRCVTITKEDQERLRHNMITLREKGNEFKSPSGGCTTMRILNQNVKMLYSGLDEQFKVEKETLLLLVQEKLDAS